LKTGMQGPRSGNRLDSRGPPDEDKITHRLSQPPTSRQQEGDERDAPRRQPRAGGAARHVSGPGHAYVLLRALVPGPRKTPAPSRNRCIWTWTAIAAVAVAVTDGRTDDGPVAASPSVVSGELVRLADVTGRVVSAEDTTCPSRRSNMVGFN